MLFKIRKIWLVLQRKMIGLLNYFSPNLYMKFYSRYLKKIGIRLGNSRPNYIDPSVHFDGVDYSLIKIGSNATISREVLFLTHDYSVYKALVLVGKENEFRRVDKPITLGDNCFVGARATLLPGTVIGDNCIIGACSVVKGHIDSNSVVAGNPAVILKRTEEYAEQYLQKRK